MQKGSLHQVDDSSRATASSPYLVWLIWVIWLPFIISPLVHLLQSPPPLFRLVSILAATTLFIAIYLLAAWYTALRLVKASALTGQVEVSIWLITAILAALSCFLALSGQTDQWLGPFIFTSGYVGGSLPTKRAILAVAILALLIVIPGYLVQLSWLDLLQAGVFVVAVSFIITSVIRSIKTSWELQTAREEIARLAVTTERLRIARDLHDLLGHNLSLIALKSELAGRLLQRSPERAAIEIGDVEQVARTTLQEVREAVASYRQPTLANELHGTQEILAAAGITYRYEGNKKEQGSLSAQVEAVLAWVVREGVTNVIRHSRARQCTILLQRDKRMVRIEISNDGTHVGDHLTYGNGLQGLAERVAALDGHLGATHRVDGLFCLSAVIPLTHEAETSGIAIVKHYEERRKKQ